MNELIVFEGIDGAGKSTQLRRLGEWLRGLGAGCQEFKEPTDGPYGSQIRRLAKMNERLPLAEEYALFLQDRRWNISEQMQPALDRGEVVLLDRYYYSTAAYQGIRGMDGEKILRENEVFAVKPGLTLFFELPVEDALIRIQQGRNEGFDAFEKKSDLLMIHAAFEKMNRPEIVRVDARLSPDALQEHIRGVVLQRFPRLKALANRP